MAIRQAFDDDAPALPPVWANDLIAAVCRAFEVPRDGLLGLSREPHLVAARQAAIWLLRVRPKPGQTGYAGEPRRRSYPEIGRIIRAAHLRPMDHGTAIYACGQVAARSARDPEFAAVMAALAHDAPAKLPAPEPAKISLADNAARPRAKWLSEVRAVLGDRPAPLRPVMELAEDDTDARDRASGSMKLTAALAAAGRAVAA